MTRYLIQYDTASKRYPLRVVTTAGEGCGYFRTMADAIGFCEVAS